MARTDDDGFNDREPVATPSILAAVQSGDRRSILEALAMHIAAEMDATVPESVLAPLSARLIDVTRELASLTPPETESEVERIARERAERLALAERDAANDVVDAEIVDEGEDAADSGVGDDADAASLDDAGDATAPAGEPA